MHFCKHNTSEGGTTVRVWCIFQYVNDPTLKQFAKKIINLAKVIQDRSSASASIFKCKSTIYYKI